MDAIIQEVRTFFQGREGIAAVFLFGSQAAGTPRSESDVDIAVLFEPTQVPAPMDIIELREELAHLLRRDVDIVCLNTASPIIGMQVQKSGQEVLLLNRKEYATYAMTLFTAYADLKRLRQPMESELAKRKFYDRA